MEANDTTQLRFQILTFRDGQEVIAEDVESEVAARLRFASAIDQCKSHDGDHAHRVEMRSGAETLEVWDRSQNPAAATGPSV